MIPHIFNGNGTISIMIDGKMKPVDTAHKFYEEIKEALKAQDWDAIPGLVNIAEKVEKAINESTVSGQVVVTDGQVLYNGTPIHNTLTNRIVEMARDGFDIGHMVKFLENLMKNPSYRAVTELYDFLEAGAIPITENGTFLTYKKIRNDWTDIHSGNFDNSIGAVVEMPRNMVNEDSSQTCSAGLHVCSYDYLPNFGCSSGDRVVVCEVNPRDCVSVPSDYSNSKMRVCRYEVISEVEDYEEKDVLSTSSVVTTDSLSGIPPYAPPFADMNEAAKDIGKRLEEALDFNDLEVEQLGDILDDAVKDDLTYGEKTQLVAIADSGEYRRLGKKVARYIIAGKIDAGTFDVLLEEACEDDEDTCDRCGTDLEGNEECSQCGYYQ